MEITTTLGALAAAAPALSRLAAHPLPITTAYQVAKLAKLAQVEIDLFLERRNALIKELGEEREATAAELAAGGAGPVVQVKAEHVAAYTAQLEKLGAVVVVLPSAPIDLASLTIAISPADLITLGPLLKEPA